MRYFDMTNAVEDVRVEFVNYYDPKHNGNMIQFLKDKNLFMEMLTNENYTNGIKHPTFYNGRDYEKYSEEFTYKGEKYAWIKKPLDVVRLVKILPRVFNDNIFTWKKNKKYGTLECVFQFGMFEFTCIYKENDDTLIDVRYAKCDNRHRNKVTITTIEVADASNDKILKAIQSWKEEFTNEVQSIA